MTQHGLTEEKQPAPPETSRPPSAGRRAKSAIKRLGLKWRAALDAHTPPWAKRAFGPAARYLDMLLIDHGLFRLVYLNRHRLGAQAWRSAQPAPHDIRDFARRGVRTIVNLRGPRDCGSYWLEQDACRRHGITLVDLPIRSRAAPTRESLREASHVFDRVEYPMLLHCKSGADRAGFMSVLYRHLREGEPLAEAMDQLSFRFGHIRQADTGILDHLLDCYLVENGRRPIAFLDWVETVYDPEAIKRSFKSRSWANRIVDGVLRRE